MTCVAIMTDSSCTMAMVTMHRQMDVNGFIAPHFFDSQKLSGLRDLFELFNVSIHSFFADLAAQFPTKIMRPDALFQLPLPIGQWQCSCGGGELQRS